LRYFIVGFKNSGKTTFGRKLAKKLNISFIDMDEYIEEKTGKTIPEMYTNLGDEAFRRMEWKALKELIRSGNLVIATGGGAPCHCENMSLMEQHGEVIYLKVSDETLVRRLKKAARDRPIVKGKTEDDLRKYVAELRLRCEHHLKRAKYIIDGENIDLDELTKMLSPASENA